MIKSIHYPFFIVFISSFFFISSLKGSIPVNFNDMIEELRMNQFNDYSIETLNKEDLFSSLPDNGITGSSNNTLDTLSFDKIFRDMNEVKDISEATTINLPVGISSSGLNAKLLIVNAYFSVDYVMLDILAQVIIERGSSKETFRFGCWNVKYYYEHGFQGEPKLALLSDVQIPITKDGTNLILKGDFNRNEGAIDLNKVCYIGFGCEGIQSLEGQFIGTLTIAEEKDGGPALIQPVSRVGNDFVPDGEEGLTIDFKTTCSLDNFYFSTSLGLFTIRDTDVIFDVKGLTVDLSNEQSHQNLNLGNTPESLDHKVWQGFFMESFMVYLPKSIERENRRVSLGANNFRIDENGISCKIGGTEILDMESGNAGGWPISVDSVNISITNSIPDFFRFKGALKLPVMGEGENDTIHYTAVCDIESNSYSLSVKTNNELIKNLGIFDADLSLTACTLSLARNDNETLISADFNGSITLGGEKLNGVGLCFENFSVNNKGEIGIVRIGQTEETNKLLAGFPIVIGDCGFNNEKLDIAVAVHLIDKGKGDAIGGEASATIYCKRELVGGKERWLYDGFDLNKIQLEADFSKFSIDGYVEFYEDEFKKGFSGGIMLQLEIDPSSPVTLSTNVEFGTALYPGENIDSLRYRYFYIDMFVRGIDVPLFTGVNMTGIGGGVSYHMERNEEGRNPNHDKKLWLMVNTEIVIAGGSKSNPSEAALEIQFLDDWSVEYVQLFGAVSLAPPELPVDLDIMSGYNKLVESTNNVDESLPKMLQLKKRMPAINLDPRASEVKIELILKMEFGNDFVMTGAASAYVNLLDVIVGKAEENSNDSRAGTVYMVFRKDEWFVHAGYKHYNTVGGNNLPNVNGGTISEYEPLKLALQLPVKTKNELLSLQAYLLLGHNVPGSLPHPKTDLGVSGFPDTDVFNNMSKSDATSSLTSGLGMAFGAAMQVNIPKFNYMLLYAKLDAYVGFDVLLRHYEECLCSNHSGDFGINNWYAQGQAYAGVGADIGIRVKVFSFEKEVSALKGEMAMMLQAKLPNPTWFNGMLYGYYSVLGGAVSGDFSLAVTFGDPCETIDNPVPGEVPAISIVNRTNPIGDDPYKLWNPLDYPVVHFNYEFNKPFTLDDGTNAELNYKLICDKVEGSYSEGNSYIPVELDVWFSDSKKMFIHQKRNEQNIIEPFKANTQYIIEFTVALYTKIDGEWIIAKTDGVDANEKRVIKFTTTTLPDKLSPSSIVDMYPAIDQDYFYKNQRDGGFIQVEQSRAFLFNGSKVREINVEFYDPQNNLVFSKIANFNSSDNKLSYEIDNDLIDNKTIYNVRVSTKIGENAKNSKSWAKNSLLSFDFKTSEYNTFEAKIDEINSIVSRPGSSPGQIIFSYEYVEPFGREEILGNPQMNGGKPLLQTQINTDGHTSLDGRLLSLIYNPDFCNTTCFSGFSFDKTNNLNTICYNTNWDIMKSEMESESTFPFILTNFDKAIFGINQIKQNASRWCLENTIPANEEEYYYASQTSSSVSYNMLYEIVEDYKSDSGGDCSFDFPQSNNRYEIPLSLKYYNSTAKKDVKLIYSM